MYHEGSRFKFGPLWKLARTNCGTKHDTHGDLTAAGSFRLSTRGIYSAGMPPQRPVVSGFADFGVPLSKDQQIRQECVALGFKL